MSNRRRRKMSTSQTLFWVLSLFLVASMVISLIVVALPTPAAPTATPVPIVEPTATWAPFPSATPSPTAPPRPTITPTEPVMGPVEPTATPIVTATAPPIGPLLSTVTPTVTATPAAASLGITFAVCGDSRGNPAIYERLLAAVQADGSQFLVHTGDLVNAGSEDLWQEFRGIMADFSLPFYPVAGNHDGLDGKLDGFLAHSGAPAAHYSLDRGTVHLALADSHNGGITASELSWLAEDLNSTRQPLKMVFLHHPPFDPDGTDHIMAFGREAFMALMAEQAVDYVFAGHIHAFAQGERDGVVYTITGGAGAPLYSQDHPQAFYHYLRVQVQGEEVAVEVVKV